jgi:hypothetical protein
MNANERELEFIVKGNCENNDLAPLVFKVKIQF